MQGCYWFIWAALSDCILLRPCHFKHSFYIPIREISANGKTGMHFLKWFLLGKWCCTTNAIAFVSYITHFCLFRSYCLYIPSGMECPVLSRKLRPSGGSFAMRVSVLTILHFHFQGVLFLDTHPPKHIFAWWCNVRPTFLYIRLCR